MSDWNPIANEIFLVALEIEDPAARDVFIAQRCAGNEDLRREVESMLADAAKAGSFLDRPALANEIPPEVGIADSPTQSYENGKEVSDGNAETASQESVARQKVGSQRIGPYKLLQRIGEGGMGEVWMAEQEQPVRRRVALKVIKQGLDSRQVIARFEAERQALAMMDHQNIARVLDAGTTSTGQPFFVMDLVNGIPLTKYCDDNRLSLEERLALFTPVCQAVQHAHQKGIIHRDLKPSNVLVTLYDGKPVPKVIDFGLAKALQHQHKLTDKTLFTEFGQVVGTLQYMSPEQAEMNALDIDTRTDVYSLGVMLYELLTGSTPIEKETLQKEAVLKVLETIREKDPPRPSARLSSSGDAITGISAQRRIDPRRLQNILRGDLDWIVMKALEKDRTRRYGTATAFSDDLSRYLNSEPVNARPPSAIYRVRKLVRKNRGLVTALATITVLLVGGIIGTTWFGMAANVATKAAKQSEKTAVLEKTKAEAAGETAKASELAAVASKEKTIEAMSRLNFQLTIARQKEQRIGEAVELLYEVPEKHRHLEWHMARRQIDGSDLTLYGHCEPVTSVTISSDGSLIVSGAKDGTIRLWDAKTGAERHVFVVPFEVGPYIEQLGLSPDQSLIAFGCRGIVGIIDAQTGDLRRTFQASESFLRNLVFSPVGGFLATIDNDRAIKLWDVQTGTEIQHVDPWHVNGSKSLAFSPDGTKIVSVADSHSMRLWDVKTGAELHTFTWDTQGLDCVAFSPDGLSVGAADFDGNISIWDVRSGNEVHHWHGHRDTITSIAFSPDGSQLVSASDDDTIKLWDLRSSTELFTLVGHMDNVNSVVFSPDGSRIVSGSDDRLIKVWDARYGTPMTRFLSGADSLYCLAFSPDGEWIAAGGKTIQMWNTKTGSLDRVFSGHTDNVDLLRFSPDGTKLFSSGFGEGQKGRAIKTWDVHSGAALSRLDNIPFWTNGIEIGPEGLPATLMDDATIKWWDGGTGAEVRKASIGDQSAKSAAFSLDGNQFAFASFRERDHVYLIHLWDAATGQEIRSGTLNGDPKSIVFSPDGSLLAIQFFGQSGNEDRIIGIWDVRNGCELRSLVGHRDEVKCVAFSPDSLRLASVSSDGTLKLWDVNGGKELCSFADDSVNGEFVAFSPDGSTLATTGRNGTVHFWEVGAQSEIRLYPDGARIERDGVSIWYGDKPPEPAPPRYFVDNRRAWITEAGDKISMPEDWPQSEELSNPSNDGRWQVIPYGRNAKFVALVDLAFKKSPKEKAYREQRGKLDSAWHATQAEQTEKDANWFAATFHRAWFMKADPTSEASYDALHSAYDKWRNQIADGKKPADNVITAEPAATQKEDERSDLEMPPKPEPNPPLAPDDLLAPIVREMLALPRGGAK